MSLRSRISKLESALEGESCGKIAFFNAFADGGPIIYDGHEYPDLAAAQAACGNIIVCLLPCKMELAEWIEAVEHRNNATPAASGN